MINCIIIEDQPPAQRILKTYISKTEELNLVDTFLETEKAISLIESSAVDLIFLDINLPRMSGIDFLRSMPNHPNIILTTAFSDYALESYEFNVVDYLLKPISQERFEKAILKLNVLLNNRKTDINKSTISIKSGCQYIRIDIDDILYIKSDVDYIEIHTVNKVYLSSETLKQWLEKSDVFFQVHRSFIMNFNHLEKVIKNKIHLKNGDILPIGRTFKKSFINKVS